MVFDQFGNTRKKVNNEVSKSINVLANYEKDK